MYNLLRGKPLSMFETTVHGLISNFVKGRRLRVTDLESRPGEASPDLLAPATPAPPP